MPPPPRPAGPLPELDDELVRVCEAMVRYALASGILVPEQVVEVVDLAVRSQAGGEGAPAAPALRQVVRAYSELVRIVAPASPRTILLVSEGRQSRMAMLGPVRLVRQMLVAVLILLVTFVGLATSPEVNTTSGDIFHSDGTALLINELFFIAAGGLGAAFSALFTAYRYIADNNYDPKYESTYWLRFILGLMAGLLLPALIPLGADADSSAFTKPLLALLGGFSASVLYRILERLVAAVESLVRSDSRELRSAQREASVARAAEHAGQERLRLIGELRRLEGQARRGEDPALLAGTLERLIGELTPGATTLVAAPRGNGALAHGDDQLGTRRG